jgi:LysM repeat protein
VAAGVEIDFAVLGKFGVVIRGGSDQSGAMRKMSINRNHWMWGGLTALALALGAVGCKTDDPPSSGQMSAAGGPFSSTMVGTATADVSGANPAANSIASVDGGAANEPPPNIPTELYEIQKGDTLTKIATDHGTSISMLQRINGIEGSFIRYGQKIKVPAGAGSGDLPETLSPRLPTTPEDVTPVPPARVPPVSVPPVVVPPVGAPPSVDAGSDPAASGIDGASPAFGFGGESAPRTSAPTRRDDDLPLLPR